MIYFFKKHFNTVYNVVCLYMEKTMKFEFKIIIIIIQAYILKGQINNKLKHRLNIKAPNTQKHNNTIIVLYTNPKENIFTDTGTPKDKI